MAKNQNKHATNKKFSKAEKEFSTTTKGSYKDRRDSGNPTKKGSNDSSWYNHNPQLVKDVASIPLNNFLGLPLSTGKWRHRFPGIMSIRYVKTPGIAYTSADPINVVMRDQYAYIRKSNSGARNYEDVDLGLYLLGAAELYSYGAFLRKIYGCARMYVANNRYFPNAILQSMGVDPDDIQKNLANLRAYINTYNSKISIVKIPTNFKVVERWNFMDSALYADGKDISCAQIYNFVPQFFRYYDETSDERGGRLNVEALSVFNPHLSNFTPFTFAALRDIGEILVSHMLNSEDIGIISGDIQKAYGENNCYTISDVNEDYVTPILYDEEVLLTIQNATDLISQTIQTAEWTNGEWDIRQFDGNMVFAPNFPTLYGMGAANYINMPMDDPTPMDIMIATRLKASLSSEFIGEHQTTLPMIGSMSSCGTEFVTDIRIWTLNDLGKINPSLKIVSVSDGGYMDANAICALSNFEWHPIHVRISGLESDNATNLDRYITGICWDAHKVGALVSGDLDKLHYTAILSLFGTPISK